jgi:uncharacterized protein (TIGR03435 family)
MKPRALQIVSTLALVVPAVAISQTSEPKVGEPPPPLHLQSLLQAPEGAKTAWPALKGKVVVLEFWATWCGPCVAAIPHLNDLADQFKDEPVQFIAITDEDEHIITPFLKRRPIHAWVGLDAGKSTFKSYGITGIPHTVMVDKKGKIVAITHPTSLTEKILKDALAGRKLALAQPTQSHRGGIRPGEVPYSGDNGQSPLFQVLIRPTPADNQGGTGMASGNGGLTFSGGTVFDVISACYGISPVRVVTNCTLPDSKFDFVVKTQGKPGDVATTWLRQAVETTFNLHPRRETRTVGVFVLSVATTNAQYLTPTVSTGGSSSQSRPGNLLGVNQTIGALAWSLEGKLRKPVLDETGLTNHYDFELKWADVSDEHPKPDSLVEAVREQLGLELKPATRPVEMLVVEKGPKPPE